MPKKSIALPAKKASTHAQLPTPPTLLSTIGPSFILLGLALGSGELILWPHLAAKWGMGLLWGGLLGITLQYFLNTEAMRYALAWGESVFVGFRKLGWWWPIWFIISTFIPWSIPGFSSASSQIINNLLGLDANRAISILLLLMTGAILTTGKVLVKTMEIVQRTLIMVGLPLILLITLWLTNRVDWIDTAWGLVGRGDGWWFFPQGIAISSFLGAFAYSGAGGNLNLAQSYYIKESGFGMGRYAEKISSLLQGGNRPIKISGQLFANTSGNLAKWRAWWRLVNAEHFLVFWLLGLATIILLSVLAKSLTYGIADPNDLAFLYQESAIIAQRTHQFFGTLFLIIAALMLFSTQMGVLESSSRIISENIVLLFKRGGRFNMSLAFYCALWGQILLGILILLIGFQQPRFLLTLGAILNGAAMMVAFPLLSWLNTHFLPAPVQPSWWRRGILLAGGLFFLFFFLKLF